MSDRILGVPNRSTRQLDEQVDTAIPTPVPIEAFAKRVGGLSRYDELEPRPILTLGPPTVGPSPSTVTTTTTTTTTPDNAEWIGPKPIRRMERGLSTHRIARGLAHSEKTVSEAPRERTPSPMGRSAPLSTERDEVEPVRTKPIQPDAEKRERMVRAVSVHRVPRFLDRTDEVPRKAEQPREEGSMSESSSRSFDEDPTASPLVDSFVFRKVSVSALDRQKSRKGLERRMSGYRDQRQLAKTAENPRTAQAERTPPPMENSAPAELVTRRDSDPPEEWRKAWRDEINSIKTSDWCGKVLAIIARRADSVPNLDKLKELPRMRAAYQYGLSAAEAASIFLYTSAAFKEINEPLRERNLDKLRSNRRNALKTIIANMDSGLAKLPEVKEPLIRVVKLEHKVGQKLRVNTVWRESAFGSCFRAAKKNMKWDGNYELLIVVTSGARDVSVFSDAPREGEVLVERGRTYRITERTDGQGSQVKLELAEIPAKRKDT